MQKGATGERTSAPSGPAPAKGPRPERRPEKARHDKPRQEKKKPEPAPFNNPFARAFAKDKDGKEKR